MIAMSRMPDSTGPEVESIVEGAGIGSLLVVAIALLLVPLVGFWINHSLQSSNKNHNLPPGPRPWPVVGNLLLLTRSHLPHRSLRALAAKFGGLMYLRLGSIPCIVVSNASVAKELFQKNDAIFSSRPLRLAATIYTGSTNYKNLAGAPYGTSWQQLRRLCANELFSSRRHASYQKARTEEIQNMIHVLLDDSRKGNPVNLRSWLFGVTCNNMTRMILDKRYFGNETDNQQEKEELQTLVTRIFALLGAFIICDYVPWLSFITKLQGWHSKFEDLRDFKDKVMTKLFEVEKHRQRAEERKKGHMDEDYVPDFVDVLLEAPLENGNPLPTSDLILVLMDMTDGGTDTIATTVEWAMAELMLHPAVMKQAQDELNIVVGTNRTLQESDIAKLPYLQAIVKEAFRLHPAVALSLPRLSTGASSILGFHLPAQTELILNLFAIHRDRDVYKNPDTFDPQRFLDHPEVSTTSAYDSYELIPFSAGRRMCPGHNLGNVMVSMLLAHLIHSFEWAMPEGESTDSLDMSECFGLAVCRKKALHLVAKPRSPAFLY